MARRGWSRQIGQLAKLLTALTAAINALNEFIRALHH